MFILSNLHTFLFVVSAQVVLITCVFQMHVLPLFQKQADIEAYLLNEKNTKEILISFPQQSYESCYHYGIEMDYSPPISYPVLTSIKYQIAVYKKPPTQDIFKHQLFSRPPPSI